ncbi:ARL2_Bind_BART domain-containing protein [Durusdinium trenchii]|uniref:ARL2_Bind_BART domain-containing protein n=1 Tax=Durusdinium trenchii TaxID=1381693 RepID=A0ABP0HKR6_9DINO
MATSDFAYDFVEDQTSPRLRQKEHEDWLITSSLEPLRDGLEDCNFQHLLQEFAAEHAGDFMALWPDGSHPLLWTLRHQEYTNIFESQLENTLAEIGMTRESFQSTMQHLHEVRETLGDTAENLDSFLTSLTAAADYDTFLKVMLNEMIRQQEAGILAAAPGSQQIQVTVPEGLSIDADYRRGYPPTMQTMPVEYQGYTYQVPIPSGYGPGASFNVTVAMPCPS